MTESEPERSDEDLVAATLAGDSEEFGELVNRYQGKIFNLAYGITGNLEDAQDATQNAFLRAFDRLTTFDPKYRFFSWIYRIGVNESLRLVGARRPEAELATSVEAPSSGPEEEARGRETGEQIRQVMGLLTPDQRAVIVLRHLHGLSYLEMAGALDIPEKTVKSRLFSARQALRKELTSRGLTPGN